MAFYWYVVAVHKYLSLSIVISNSLLCIVGERNEKVDYKTITNPDGKLEEINNKNNIIAND